VPHRAVRARFWVEIVCGTVGLFLLALTLMSRAWIELIFGFDPDGGNGALEFAIASSLLAIVVASGAAARREWRRSVAP
jgi:hypothetical protein